MIIQPCTTRFREYEPVEEFRALCPYILVTCRGPHRHPIPLPTKTPASVCHEIFQLLGRTGIDLPDMTARRFLRHPIVTSHLQERFPKILSPTLSDLHISLANRSHLSNYIDKSKKEYFPFGTGWKGECPISVHQS